MEQAVLSDDGAAVFDASVEAVHELGWSVVDLDADALSLTAITPITWHSWRDTVEVQVTDLDGECVVGVASKPRYQIVNWGQDARNERRFLETLEELH